MQKKIEDLTFIDDGMFQAVMHEPGISEKVIENLLHVKVEKIVYPELIRFLGFSQYAFNDHGYFFDSDEKWYYIIPGPFRIKIPIELIYNNLDDEDYEFDFRNKVVIQLMTYIFQNYKNEKFDKLINELNLDKKNLLAEIVNAEFPAPFLWEHYRYIYNFFDDWVVVKAKSIRTYRKGKEEGEQLGAQKKAIEKILE